MHRRRGTSGRLRRRRGVRGKKVVRASGYYCSSSKSIAHTMGWPIASGN